MKEMTILLEKLADKLGTTVEKLWSVLLRQAPISGAVDLILCIILVVASIFVFKFVNKKTTGGKDGYADWDDEGKFFAWAGAAIIIGINVFLIVCSAESIISAFFNPEYWALSKILSKVK
jgi:hypothetical protein